MRKAVEEIQSAVDIPVAIDSTNILAVEEGLKTFVGRPLINSTTGEEKQLELILPLAKKYGAAVLGLCLDESGIPDTAAGRVEIARKIYARAKEYGLRDEDIFIDTLVKTASAEQAQVMETIGALSNLKQELPVGTVLGVSNVSHGLPEEIINSAYLAMAMAAGLDLPIVNPFDQRMMDVVAAAGVILNRDPGCSKYIETYRDYKPAGTIVAAGGRAEICSQCNIPELVGRMEKPVADTGKPVEATETVEDNIMSKLSRAVLEGGLQEIDSLLHKALNEGKLPALDIVNQGLIPGIEKAGQLYDQKKYFLPQLMRAAETMKHAFTIVKPFLSDDAGANNGVIIMATVEGDIHDIGKNIVCVLLENYGFKVIDLGKDVSAEVILNAAEAEKADIIGLSALMTTTMPRMKDIIDGVKDRGLPCKVMVGGAVLTEDYSQQIGADAYSEDARAAVTVAQRLLSIIN